MAATARYFRLILNIQEDFRIVNLLFPVAHTNVKVFVTQCGLQSTEEAVARGMPIVGIPFIADQEMNAQRLEEQGVGLNLDFTTITKEKLRNAILEVAENKK